MQHREYATGSQLVRCRDLRNGRNPAGRSGSVEETTSRNDRSTDGRRAPNEATPSLSSPSHQSASYRPTRRPSRAHVGPTSSRFALHSRSDRRCSGTRVQLWCSSDWIRAADVLPGSASWIRASAWIRRSAAWIHSASFCDAADEQCYSFRTASRVRDDFAKSHRMLIWAISFRTECHRLLQV